MPAVHRHGVVTSTMDLLHDLAAEGAEQGTAVVAEEQAGGRGSRGREWHSPRGGLWLSYLLRPAAAGTELLSLRAGLAVADAMECLVSGLPVALKWPNDVMLGERKLGGILCEARWAGGVPAWVAVGIGINVRNAVPPDLRDVAVTLDSCVPDITPDAVLEALLPRLRLVDRSSPRLDGAELRQLAGRDWLSGRRVTHPVEGYAQGIAADGALVVRRDSGIVEEVRAGSVELAPRTIPS